MRRRTQVTLLLMLGSVALFLGSVLWGTYFAFPEPDASAEKAAQMRFHETVSTWGMLLALAILLGSCIALWVNRSSSGRPGSR